MLYGGEIRTVENDRMLLLFLNAKSENVHKLEVVFKNEQSAKIERENLHNVKVVLENVQSEKKTTM